MGLMRTAAESLRKIERFMGPEHTKTLRFCALLALIATALLSVVPYTCGLILDAVVEFIETQEGFPINTMIDQCTLVMLLVVIWYTATTHSKREIAKLGLSTGRRIRDGLNKKMMSISIKDLDNIPSGDLSTRFTNDLPAVIKLISSDYTGFFVNLTMIVGILVMMIITSPVLALIYLAIMPLTLMIGRYITNQSEEEFAVQRKKIADLNTKMSDIITTHPTIKIEKMEGLVLEDFRNDNRDFTKAFVSTRTRSGMLAPLVSIMANVGYLVTVIAGSMMLFYGMIEIGMLMTFMIYVRLVNNPLNISTKVFDGIRDEVISLDRINEVLDYPERIEQEKDESFTIGRGVVELKDVCFSYDEGKEILHSVSFVAEPDQLIALVGPTASGKTTVANLMMGFYESDSGSIRIDGMDIDRIPRHELGSNVTAVLQNPWVFDGSIRENIIYNRKGITEEEFMDITKAVGLDEYVRRLPEGYETKIGSDLRRLPLAQSRMLALSRALIGNPKILILDEAVAGLDPITGQSVIDRLKMNKKGRTTIIITHNQVLIEQADKVIRMENGRIVGS